MTRAESRADEADGARSLVWARTETHLRLFRRALWPGPRGAVVSEPTLAPLHQYLLVGVRDAATPLSPGGFDAEVSAWGRAHPLDASPEPRLDADVTVANVQQRWRHGHLRLGRQQISGGAARHVRFDGARAGLEAPGVASFDAYAGWTVLPRWDERPTYRFLGSAEDARLDESAALADLQRSGHRVLGARAHYASGGTFRLGASYHEEREAGALGRRDLGGDLWLGVARGVEISARAVLDADRMQLSDARTSLELSPHRTLRVSLDYDRYDPTLLMSRQSVIGVFAAEAFDSLGVSLSYRPRSSIATHASARAQVSDGIPSYRARTGVRATLDRAERLQLYAAYARVASRDDAYHALEQSLRYAAAAWLDATLQLYAYAYDRPVAGRRGALSQVATLGARLSSSLRLVWGASVVQSPYARSDVQSTLSLFHDGS